MVARHASTRSSGCSRSPSPASRAWRSSTCRPDPTFLRPAARDHARGRSTSSLSNFTAVFAEQPFARWLLNSVIVAGGHDGARRLPRLHRGLRLLALPLPGAPGGPDVVPRLADVPRHADADPALHHHRQVAGPRLELASALVLVYSTTAIPFCVWMLKGYFDTIPQGARGVGADRRRLAGDDLLPDHPAARQAGHRGHRALLVHDRLERVHPRGHASWTRRPCTRRRSGCASSSAASRSSGAIFAAGAIIVAIPVVVLFLFLQKYLVSGLTAGPSRGRRRKEVGRSASERRKSAGIRR